MKKIPDHITTVQIDCEGDITKSRFIGTFKVKAVLSHADRFAAERFYGSLVPSNTSGMTEELKVRATALAELKARVVEGPEWWSGTRDGLLLVDSTPIYELLNKCQEAYMDWSNKLDQEANKDLMNDPARSSQS